MTNIGAVRKIGRFLLAQGRPSKNPEGTCSNWYLTHEGKELNCAVGCLIPKEYMHKVTKNASHTETINQLTKLSHNRKKQPALLHLNYEVLRLAQVAHDNNKYTGTWVDHIKTQFFGSNSQLVNTALRADKELT